LNVDLIGDIAEADFILCTALRDNDTETAETYRPLFEETIPRGQRFLCANPDRVVTARPEAGALRRGGIAALCRG
jgi:hypothetical protein